MLNLIRSHMTIFSSAYKSQMMVKVKFVNSVKYQNVTIKMKRNEYIILLPSHNIMLVSFLHGLKDVTLTFNIFNSVLIKNMGRREY